MVDNEINYGKPIDDDYIDVEAKRASIRTTTKEEDPKLDRSDVSVEEVDMSHIFDSRNGSGAASDVDELIDETAIIENDGRSKTRTFFYPSEADDERRYRRLIRWQDGEGDTQRAVENRAADRRRTIDIFCGHLGMGTYQRERVKSIMEDLNMSHMAHYSSEKVILAIISLVANEDGWLIRDNETYRDLIRDVNSSLKEIRKIRLLVKRKSDVI